MCNLKPRKKLDKDLWHLIEQKIEVGEYVFLNHAKKRLHDRHINDLDVLNILENKSISKRKRNKSKDTYDHNYSD